MKYPRLVVCSGAVGRSGDNLARPIVGGRGNEDVPWVAVAVGRSDGQFNYAKAEGRDRAELQLLIDEATANMAALPFSWTVSEESGFWIFKKPSLLRAYGDLGVSPSEMATDGTGIDDLSTDLLLLPGAWAEATEKLGNNLAVIVPKRGWLMVAAASPGQMHLTARLFEMADGIASRGGRHVVSGNVVLFMDGGSLSGIEARTGDSGYISLMSPDPESWFAA